jgi:PTS system ascorbate-specific IIA component
MTIGILILTHGAVGSALLSALRAFLGPDATANVDALDIAVGEPKESVAGKVKAGVDRLDQGQGVLVACDLYGATPANCALALKQAGVPLEVVCGVNLPMLLKLCSYPRSGTTPTALAHGAAETAIRSVRIVEGGSV